MKYFSIHHATFTPDSGDPNDVFPSFDIRNIKSLSATPDASGKLATVMIRTLNAMCFDLLKEGTTGQLVGCFRDRIAGSDETMNHEFGRLRVTYCHPDSEYKGPSIVTVVLVPVKD